MNPGKESRAWILYGVWPVLKRASAPRPPSCCVVLRSTLGTFALLCVCSSASGFLSVCLKLMLFSVEKLNSAYDCVTTLLLSWQCTHVSGQDVSVRVRSIASFLIFAVVSLDWCCSRVWPESHVHMFLSTRHTSKDAHGDRHRKSWIQRFLYVFSFLRT